MPDSKYTSVKTLLKPVSKNFALDFKAGKIIPFKKIWPWNELKRLIVFSIIIRLKGKVNFFINELLEDFYFSRAFIVAIKSFKEGLFRSFSSK